jgi:hypothetical protein
MRPAATAGLAMAVIAATAGCVLIGLRSRRGVDVPQA